MKTFIIKIQTPIITNSKSAICLVYNKERNICQEMPLDKGIRKIMKGELKKYFKASINGTGLLAIHEEVGQQKW